jgi:hypothetical protein
LNDLIRSAEVYQPLNVEREKIMKKFQRIVTVAALVCIVSIPSFASSGSGILLADGTSSGILLADGANSGILLADGTRSGILLADSSNSGIVLADSNADNNPFTETSFFDRLYRMMDTFLPPIF